MGKWRDRDDGRVSSAISLVGTAANDSVGYEVVPLANGNYVVLSPFFGGDRGAVSWGDGTKGLAGTVSPTDSLEGAFGSQDELGGSGIDQLADSDYLVNSSNSLTLVSGSTGKTPDGQSQVTAQNTLTSTTYVENGPTSDSFIGSNAGNYSVFVTNVNNSTNLNDATYSFASSQTVFLAVSSITTTLDAGTSVILQASDDITINSPITVTPTGKVGILTVQAGRSIFINANINTAGGSLTLTANDTLADGVVDSQRDPGNAVITMSAGTTINTGVGGLYVFLFNSTDKTNHGTGVVTLAGITSGGVTIYNQTGTNYLTLKAETGSFVGSSANIVVTSAKSINVIGNSNDSASLYDVSGQNAFAGSPTYSFFEGAGFYDQAVGFQAVNATAAAGTNDTAYLYDAAGNNVFVGTPTYSYLTNSTYFNQAVGFRTADANATAASNDAAYFFDKAGSNTFVGAATYSYLEGSGYFDQAVGFKSVYATSASGTSDVAYLSGAASGNVFTGTTSYSFMYGTGYLNEALGFKTVAATASKTDTANLYDGAGANVFTGQGASGTLADGSLSYGATGFGYVNIVAGNGTSDKAVVNSILYSLTKYGTWH